MARGRAGEVTTGSLPSLLTGTPRVFVGRDRELERLGQLWKEASAGELRVAFLAGEPGVGKTRLAAQLAAQAPRRGRPRARRPLRRGPRCPLPAVRGGAAPLRRQHAAAARASAATAGSWPASSPELAETVPGLAAPLRSDPETERYRLFDAVAAWLADASPDSPVLLVLDDLHWAAKPTLLLLRHVAAVRGAIPLLVVATYRDTEVGRGHPLSELLADLRRVDGIERIHLSGLDQQAVQAFVEAAAGHALGGKDESTSADRLGGDGGQPLLRGRGAAPPGRDPAPWTATTPALVHHGRGRGAGHPRGRPGRGRPTAVPALGGGQPGPGGGCGRRDWSSTPACWRPPASLAEDELLAALEEAVDARLLVEVAAAGAPLPLHPCPGAGHPLRRAVRRPAGRAPPPGGRSHRGRLRRARSTTTSRLSPTTAPGPPRPPPTSPGPSTTPPGPATGPSPSWPTTKRWPTTARPSNSRRWRRGRWTRPGVSTC